MRLGVLLTPGFLEAEAALAMEAARLLGWERFTVARGRTALEGSAGAVWTPKYTFVARPELDVLVIPGGPNMRKLGRDLEHQDWLNEVWSSLRAVFTGANGALLLWEAGHVSGQVAAHPITAEALAGTALERSKAPHHWQGKVCTTQGYLALARAMLDWAGFAEEARAHLGL
ncbi:MULTISPECIES: DJ-1/PfpI family protein [Meiothermus]|jgi:putative intracellular protease/amidase|uniref:ThiJ/PfpI domain protein n=1 Tax=Meiothermus ruber (strain ATCC 35948 / DSM 1279 / VKM B-1258 / 21) TaxID=504728 RepID=D3PR86_MEIRD|nr:DJ-1/PfpI family protein [Meiothermus ruber]ADD27969.1 ThiJ/PfpI domain protein [Meiothermus ruber DSM 1279]AGK04438.1 ThiJ/PfpI domain-containing protein [Meiothermus ruber DSM 1279]MCL6530300.1 DJ-1/PfpI family protein [Meiothermus ruber]GAO74907.1 ThiJ/PfpI domain-containing protein [Meiothermus ruber H328]